MAMEPTASTSNAIPAKQDAPELSIVLVCWNDKDYLEPCLHSLYEAGLHGNFDVIVVDNGSTDGSQAMLQEKFPQVKRIQNDHNAGLGRASNQGIVATRGRNILLLNNDTLVNGASLNAMADFLDTHPNAGAVGGRLLNADGSLQSGYNKFSSLIEEFLIASRIGDLIWQGFPGHYDDSQVRAVSWLSSACLMLRRQALDQVGLLDEEYFIYGDEADLQYRLYQNGWKVYFIPSAHTIHYGGGSMNRWRRRRMVYRGKMLFYRKHYGAIKTTLLRAMLGVLSLTKMLIWGVATVIPQWRDRGQKELRSNLDVIALCLKLS
jgi:GT2 family glycosyltransferase